MYDKQLLFCAHCIVSTMQSTLHVLRHLIPPLKSLPCGIINVQIKHRVVNNFLHMTRVISSRIEIKTDILTLGNVP